MNSLLPEIMTAVWLGILTSISPCPLAGNIAAISYISRNIESARKVLITGLLYTVGRTLIYLALGVILVFSLLAIPDVSFFLQNYMNKLLGPVLIITGMFLLEMLVLTPRGGGLSDKMKKTIDSMGIWGALPLGAIFALAFCPISAALFFGSLIPLALKAKSALLLPGLYGVGTALPVVLFAFLFGMGTGAVGRAFNKLTSFERGARIITGWIFIITGIYYCLDNIFRII